LDYALQYCAQLKRMSRGSATFLYVAAGRSDQLRTFTDGVPELRGLTLVDPTPKHEAYLQAGFNFLMGEKLPSSSTGFKPPLSMGPGRWLSWLASTPKLMPINPADSQFRLLGGTYAIDGNTVLFSRMDNVPGDFPDVDEVLKTLGV